MTHMGVRFGDCELSVERMELRRAGQLVDLEPQVFDVLAYLLRHHERVVPKTELLDQIWGNRFVSESALSSRIKSARRAVGDTGRDQRIIQTVYGRGYRFVADANEQPAAAVAAAAGEDGSATAPGHRVLRAVSDVAAGTGAAIQISGGPGSGKTELLRRVAETARRQALTVGRSAATPASRSPYTCVAEVLDEMARTDPGLLDAIPGGCRAELDRAFDGRLPTTRQHWFVAVREFLVVAAEQSGAVLLLDDLHLAHREALLLVDDVARLTRTHRLAVIIAQRPDARTRPGFEVVELTGGHRPRADQDATGERPGVAEALRLVELGAAPAQVADLLLAAGEPGLAAPYALEAARMAAASGLHAEVLRWSEAVRDHVDGQAEPALLSLRADALAAAGDHAAVPAYRKALAAASPDQAPGLRTRLARAAVLSGDLASAEEALAGLEPSGGPDDGAILLARGMLAYFSGDIDGADAAVEAARAMALAPGAPNRLLDVITLQGMIAHNRGEWFDRLRRELRATTETPELASAVFDSHLCVAEYLLYGHPVRTRRAAARRPALSRRHRSLTGFIAARVSRAGTGGAAPAPWPARRRRRTRRAPATGRRRIRRRCRRRRAGAQSGTVFAPEDRLLPDDLEQSVGEAEKQAGKGHPEHDLGRPDVGRTVALECAGLEQHRHHRRDQHRRAEQYGEG
jgi:DNA-binding winged helix-turn-helix (wHTH) protein